MIVKLIGVDMMKAKQIKNKIRIYIEGTISWIHRDVASNSLLYNMRSCRSWKCRRLWPRSWNYSLIFPFKWGQL